MTDRRRFIAGLAIAPVAIASPAFAQALTCTVADPVTEYLAAFRLYDDQDGAAASRFDRALSALNAWQPETARDMLRKIVARLDDHGAEPAASLPMLLAQVDRLIDARIKDERIAA